MSDTPCPVCGHAGAVSFLRRAAVPVHQNLLADSAEGARSMRRGQLDMCVCRSCDFVFNAAFDETLLSYGDHYENTQCCSSVFQEHVHGRINRLLDCCGAEHATLVEVGCGRGHFLRELLGRAAGSVVGYGFDPSYVGPASEMGGRLRFESCYYDEHASAIPADGVVCRHVVEHVRQPLVLLQAIRRAVASRPAARVFLETPDVHWILEKGVFWDFFYEHCSLFNRYSMRHAVERVGFQVMELRTVFDGQYLWTECGLPSTSRSAAVERGDAITDLAMRFASVQNAQLARCERVLAEAAAAGGVAIWGAGAKGVTFANLLDPQCDKVRCVVDINPAKQAHFLPGTGHAIVAPGSLRDLDIHTILVLNPAYIPEIRAMVSGIGLQIRVADAMSEG